MRGQDTPKKIFIFIRLFTIFETRSMATVSNQALARINLCFGQYTLEKKGVSQTFDGVPLHFILQKRSSPDDSWPEDQNGNPDGKLIAVKKVQRNWLSDEAKIAYVDNNIRSAASRENGTPTKFSTPKRIGKLYVAASDLERKSKGKTGRKGAAADAEEGDVTSVTGNKKFKVTELLRRLFPLTIMQAWQSEWPELNDWMEDDVRSFLTDLELNDEKVQQNRQITQEKLAAKKASTINNSSSSSSTTIANASAMAPVHDDDAFINDEDEPHVTASSAPAHSVGKKAPAANGHGQKRIDGYLNAATAAKKPAAARVMPSKVPVVVYHDDDSSSSESSDDEDNVDPAIALRVSAHEHHALTNTAAVTSIMGEEEDVEDDTDRVDSTAPVSFTLKSSSAAVVKKPQSKLTASTGIVITPSPVTTHHHNTDNHKKRSHAQLESAVNEDIDAPSAKRYAFLWSADERRTFIDRCYKMSTMFVEHATMFEEQAKLLQKSLPRD